MFAEGGRRGATDSCPAKEQTRGAVIVCGSMPVSSAHPCVPRCRHDVQLCKPWASVTKVLACQSTWPNGGGMASTAPVGHDASDAQAGRAGSVWAGDEVFDRCGIVHCIISGDNDLSHASIGRSHLTFGHLRTSARTVEVNKAACLTTTCLYECYTSYVQHILHMRDSHNHPHPQKAPRSRSKSHPPACEPPWHSSAARLATLRPQARPPLR